MPLSLSKKENILIINKRNVTISSPMVSTQNVIRSYRSWFMLSHGQRFFNQVYTAISINVVGSKIKAKRQDRMAFWVFTINLHISFFKCTNLYFAREEFTSLFFLSGGLSVALLLVLLGSEF